MLGLNVFANSELAVFWPPSNSKVLFRYSLQMTRFCTLFIFKNHDFRFNFLLVYRSFKLPETATLLHCVPFLKYLGRKPSLTHLLKHHIHYLAGLSGGGEMQDSPKILKMWLERHTVNYAPDYRGLAKAASKFFLSNQKKMETLLFLCLCVF